MNDIQLIWEAYITEEKETRYAEVVEINLRDGLTMIKLISIKEAANRLAKLVNVSRVDPGGLGHPFYMVDIESKRKVKPDDIIKFIR